MDFTIACGDHPDPQCLEHVNHIRYRHRHHQEHTITYCNRCKQIVARDNWESTRESTLDSKLESSLSTVPPLGYQKDDGGRQAAGWKGSAGDCGTRALTIGTDMSYNQAREILMDTKHHLYTQARTAKTKARYKSRSVRNGTPRNAMKLVLEAWMGWQWIPTSGIGEAPMLVIDMPPKYRERCITSQRNHYAAIRDNEVRDTFDSRWSNRGSARQCYGLWVPVEESTLKITEGVTR